MKRPDINDYKTDVIYTIMLEKYADQLENELSEWKEHVFDDDLTFSDGHGNEILLDDMCEDEDPGIVYEEDFSPDEMMFYMLDLIGEMVADLKEMVSDEDC